MNAHETFYLFSSIVVIHLHIVEGYHARRRDDDQMAYFRDCSLSTSYMKSKYDLSKACILT